MVADLPAEQGIAGAMTGPGASPSHAKAPLHSSVRGEGEPIVLLHGLFGMGSNLGALARHLARSYEVHQLDMPNHGRSSWLPSLDLPSMAGRVLEYLNTRIQGPVVLVGHSLGGKVAMQIALSFPAKVRALVVADIAPVTYAPSHDAVFAAINAVEAAAVTSRSEAETVMSSSVEEAGVRQFLLLSLYKESSGVYRWRFDSEGIQKAYTDLLAAPVGSGYDGPALFVSGEQSPYVQDEGKAAARALFPDTVFRSLAGTGHWLHAEKPEAFNEIVEDFVKERLAAVERGQ